MALFFIIWTTIIFISGFFVGKKHGAKTVADLQAAKDSLELQMAAWKEAAQTAVNDIKSKF